MSDDTAEAMRQQKALDDAFYAELRKRAAQVDCWDQISFAIEMGVGDANTSTTTFVMANTWGSDVVRACMGLWPD